MRVRSRAVVQSPVLLLAGLVVGCGAADGADGDAEAGMSAQDRVAAGGQDYELEGDKVPIKVAGIEIMVEIADDEAERSRGLMFRESLPENDGMLFVYESERSIGFWMRNTLIPLDIAYIDSQGRIVDIHTMQPRDENTTWSKSDAMYALEMNEGWFEANGVGVGDLIEF